VSVLQLAADVEAVVDAMAGLRAEEGVALVFDSKVNGE
jgi:hypothetical protein